MGLDQVEIIMRVEESLGLTIANADASKMRTVGDLCAYIVQQTGAEGLKACLSSAVFYRTRKAFIEANASPRNQIKLDTKLEALLPRSERRALWKAVERTLALRMPQLTRSGWHILVFLALSISLTVPPLIRLSDHLYTGVLISLFVMLPIFDVHGAAACNIVSGDGVSSRR